jgi:glycine cleavage system H protein
MIFPADLKYSRDHEWTKAEEGRVLVGITDYAQNKLGSIVFVELPVPGKIIKKGDVLVTVDSVKAVAEVYAPVSGLVEEVNESLRDNPEWINRDAYGQGWMVKLKIADSNDTDSLLSAEAYQVFVAEEEAKG